MIRRLVTALALSCLSPALHAALPAYEFCAIQVGAPTRGDAFVEPRELTLDQKKRLVDCAIGRKDAELSNWLAQVLAEDIKAGSIPAPWSREAPAPKRKRVSQFNVDLHPEDVAHERIYSFCATRHAFPKMADGSSWRWSSPHELDVARKRELVTCANANRDPDFSLWVAGILAADIKAGAVPAPVHPKDFPRAAPKPEKKVVDPNAYDSIKKVGNWFSTIIFVVGISVGLIAVGHAFKSGEAIPLLGPKSLMIVGLLGVIFSVVGFSSGRFDEMAGMTPLFAGIIGGFLLVTGVIWGVVRASAERLESAAHEKAARDYIRSRMPQRQPQQPGMPRDAPTSAPQFQLLEQVTQRIERPAIDDDGQPARTGHRVMIVIGVVAFLALGGHVVAPLAHIAAFIIHAGVVIALGVLVVKMSKGSPGPFLLALPGMALLVFAAYGATVGAGRGMFDEMGGMYPLFSSLLGYVFLGIALVWAAVARNKSDD